MLVGNELHCCSATGCDSSDERAGPRSTVYIHDHGVQAPYLLWTKLTAQKIAKLRAELEHTAPAAGPSEWTAASELAEVEKLAEMGVIVRPGSPTKSKKGKGKAKEAATGHVVFVDAKEDCKSSLLRIVVVR